MYYRADIYKRSLIKRSIPAKEIETLKKLCEPYLKNEDVTQITISKVEDIGLLKAQKGLEKILKDKML